MSQIPPARTGPELELRPIGSIPLTQVRDGAESLLTMDISDDLTSLGLQAGDKPEVPLGAEGLASYYEKQLAATQLVQHRLQKQFNQLSEEKLAFETSLSVQTAALQQQLVLAQEKAERALAQAEHAQQQVQDAHAAVGEIVGSVTHLAELLDMAGATDELTRSFEEVARSTQRTFQAVLAAQKGTQTVLEFQVEARDACQVSPLLTAVSVGSPRAADTSSGIEETAKRLRCELEDAKRREQELEEELRAAQLLFTGLEAEVVSLQHSQAKAAAKLQVSQEELVAARDQLQAARQVLVEAGSPDGSVLTQGLLKLDAHLATIRGFLESLSMPQPPAAVDASASSALKLHVGRSAEGSIMARNAKSHDGYADLSQQVAAITVERDMLQSRVTKLELHVASLEVEQESLVREHAHQMGMVAAAGAAGAAAAVAVAKDAATLGGSLLPSPALSVYGVASTANAAGNHVASDAHGPAAKFQAVALAAAKRAAAAAPADLSSDLASSVNQCDMNHSLDVPLTGSPPSPSSRPAPRRTRSRSTDISHASGSRELGEAGDVFSERGGYFQESSRLYVPSLSGVQSSYQSFTSEAPLVPTRRYTDTSELHTYPLDPMEPLEALLPSAGVDGANPSMRVGYSVRHERSRESFGRQCMASRSLSTQNLLAEVQQLQAAVCDLLVSKAVCCTEMQAEFDAQLEALQASHHAELAKIRKEQQPALSAALLPPEAVDKSTRVSEDGLPGTQYEAEVLQHAASLEMQIMELRERQQQLISSYEERLQLMQAGHEAQLSVFASRLERLDTMESERQAAISELAALQQLAEQFRQQSAEHENHILKLHEQHATELREQHMQLATQHSKHCCELQADMTALTSHMAARRHEDTAALVALHEQQLAQLYEERGLAERTSFDTERASLQRLITELREHLARQQADHLAALDKARESYEARLAQELEQHLSAAEELRRNLEDHEGNLMLRESLVVELQGQLQQLQSEKEVEEQSLQSLLSTKAWMTEEVRSLQANLKEITAKLALAEADLVAAKACGASVSTGAALAWGKINANGTDHCAVQCSAASSHVDGGGERTRHANTLAPPVAACPAIEQQLISVVTEAADQLAEAVMYAALAEAQLEAQQPCQAVGECPSSGSGGATTEARSPRGATIPSLEATDLMMETVVLHGQLDELRGKHRMLQSQLDTVAGELAYAVQHASLAELQLEHLRLERVSGPFRTHSTPARPTQQDRVLRIPFATRLAAVTAPPTDTAFTPSKPDEPLPGMDAPDHFGTDAFIPIQQARQLYKELRTARQAFGELMASDAVAGSAASREALASVWETIIAVQDKAANLSRTLLQQQQRKLSGGACSQSIAGSSAADDQPAADGALEFSRMWDCYRDACEVYELLRSDADDINTQLWRWNIRLHQQLTAAEKELTRTQLSAATGPQLAFESLLSRKEEHLRSMESQVSEMQAVLQAAQARLLRRDVQVAALQDMLAQLSEQIAVFEGVVLRCEVLSADLVSKSAPPLAMV